jgi:hypothetical protein
MKKKFSQHIKRGLPGGANQLNKFTKGVVSTEGYRSNSPDKDNPVNIINSSSITMTETDGEPLKKGKLLGVDNFGNKQLMMPGFNYQFPGSQVAEIPIDNLREQLNPARPASIPRPHPWGFIQAQNDIVGGVGINFPRGLGLNATGVLPINPNPVFKGAGSLGLNQQFGDLNLGAKIGTPVLRDYNTRKLKLDPEISLSGRYTIPYTDKKKLSGSILKEGGYIEAELTDEEIEEYKKGGYIVEEDGPIEADKLITYKNNKKLIDGVGNWQTKSDVKISSDYNDQIKARLLTGNFGYNPKTGELVKLDKSERTVVKDKEARETRRALKKLKEVQHKDEAASFKDLYGQEDFQREDFAGNFLSPYAVGHPIFFGKDGPHDRIAKDYRGGLSDLYRYYGGLPLQNNILQYSKTAPTDAKDKDAKYISLNKDNVFLDEVWKNYLRVKSGNLSRTSQGDKEQKVKDGVWRVSGYSSGGPDHHITEKPFDKHHSNAIGRYKISEGKDDKGHFIQYYDKFDQGTGSGNIVTSIYDFVEGVTNARKPFEIYDRVYYNPQTMERTYKEDFKEGGSIEELPKAQPGMQTSAVLPPEYLRSQGFKKSVNQILDEFDKGFNIDASDFHEKTMFGEDVVFGGNWNKIREENPELGAQRKNLIAWSDQNQPGKDFVNSAAYSKAMNELAVNAGGKRVINIPFADNPTVMRTEDDDIEYEKYYAPRTIVERGKFNPKTLNANQPQVAPEMDGLIGGKEGGYMDIEASEEEIEMYKRGGYIIEELPNKKGECIGCLDKKQKGDAGMPECPDGAKYDFKRKSCVCSGKTRWDGTQCVQDVAETTVYKKQESRRKQLKLMDRLKLLKQAYKQFHNKGGFGNIILDVDDKTDKIPKLKQLVQLYEKELKDVEKQHAPAFTALKQLKENNPEKYKNFKLKDIYDPQTFEELRGLYKEGKLGDDSGQNDMLFRYFNKTLGKGLDLNIASGGPGGSYDAKEAEGNWMHDAQGFTDMLGTGVNNLMLGVATLPLGGSGAALGRVFSPVVRGTGAVLKNPYVRGALTGYGLLQAPRHVKGAYDAYQKDDWTGVAKNTALLGTDLIPALKFKNVLPTAKGAAKLVKDASLKELASGTKYLGKFNPLRLKSGYNPQAVNFKNPLLQKYLAPNINNLRAVGAAPATGNVITGAKDSLGAMYRLGKATAIPIGAYELGQMGSKGAENITHTDIDRAGSRILDIYNPLPHVKFLQQYRNNPLARYAIREGKDVLKAGFDFDAENWGKGVTRLIGTALGNKSAGQYTTKLFGNKLQDVTERYALPAAKDFFRIPGIDKPYQNFPVIRTDPDGRIIDSDIQTTEKVDVDRPKQIIMADNYKSDTPQIKRSKTKSRTLKEGGVIETMLTQKEIDMLRMGGYVVEEI